MSLSSLIPEGAFSLRSSHPERSVGRTRRQPVAVRPAVDVPAAEAEDSKMESLAERVQTVPIEEADHLLLQRFQSGDEKGYVELYVRRQAEVYTFCLRLAAGDRDSASDIFQDVWLKVYRKAHTFREGTNVLGWLYTIARTTFLNHRRQRTHVGLDEQHSSIASTDRSMHPEFRNEQQTIKLRVEAAIAQLPLEIREPFILREFDGFSYLEIADQLSITHGAVRQRIYRAKQAMRELLSDLIDDEDETSFSEEAARTATVRKHDHGNV